ncbi:hypothetical protein KFL_007960060 [Klebsormidium nitens]|uniref:Protein PHLOEM PROTEIN 2-LIKE A10 n=1 Tax=Klebsormidium nitens TaxID=105231 RepID=A0A1Y1IQH6_KLENI|nr:hypothetical protein KFL_007960060 [Klebsormidium nitens]|eukprot:GAQ91501.1 hypothetical protein KFL_007960060 [Klebsormidium nitens]
MRKKHVIVGGALILVGAYAGYKVYTADVWTRAKQQLCAVEEACTALSHAAKGSGDIVHLVTTELETFLQSDSDEVPRSIRQMLKIAASQEFQQAAASLSGSLVKGVVGATQGQSPMSRSLSGGKCFSTRDADWSGVDYDGLLQSKAAAPYLSSRCACDAADEPGFVDKVMDKLFTKPGRGFASAIVGSVVRELTAAYLDSGKGGKSGDDSGPQPGLLDAVFEKACTDKGRALVTDCVTTLVVNAVTVFLDKTAGVNVYDDMWASMSKPGNKQQVRDLVGTLANSAVDTLVRTSHEVLTSEKPSRPPASALRERAAVTPSSSLEPRVLWPEERYAEGEPAEERLRRARIEEVIEREKGVGTSERRLQPRGEPPAGERGLLPRAAVGVSRGGASTGGENQAWLQELFQTLIDPQNRRFLMDVTGIAAYEAIRALVAGLHEVLWRSPRSSPRQGGGGAGVASAVVGVSRTLDDYFRALAAKALVCVTVCLALCLNMVSGVSYV